jgi:hypothetical protein
MSRTKKAIDDNNYDLALQLLDALIEIQPDYTEAWIEPVTATDRAHAARLVIILFSRSLCLVNTAL